MQLLQMNQQSQNVNAQPQIPQSQGQNIGLQSGQRGQSLPVQQTALQKLQKEKELLRQRQEELNRQVRNLINNLVLLSILR